MVTFPATQLHQSPPFGWYQSTLLGDQGTCEWLAYSHWQQMAVSRTSDPWAWINGLTTRPTPRCHHMSKGFTDISTLFIATGYTCANCAKEFAYEAKQKSLQHAYWLIECMSMFIHAVVGAMEIHDDDDDWRWWWKYAAAAAYPDVYFWAVIRLALK